MHKDRFLQRTAFLMKRTRMIACFVPCLVPSGVFAHAVQAEHGPALHWNWDPLTLALLALSGGLYLAGLARLWRQAGQGAGIRPWQAASFWTGWLVLWAALVSPLDPLGEMLFSAHMVQHELLMIVAAPLLVLARPLAAFVWALPPSWRGAAGGAFKWKPWKAAWRAITHPLAAWTIHALVLWVWHAPPFFQASLQGTAVHVFQHLSFLAAALLFWWSLFNERHGRGAAVIYLLTTAMHTGVLGALLTFSTQLWYPLYAVTAPQRGFAPLEDQQLGGLIMWIPGGLSYLFAGLWLVARLLQQGELRESAARRSSG